jgi:putative membrane protein
MPGTDPEPPPGGQLDITGDATRRTHLANERTYLAWWRTGVTALAASVGIGRLVPGLTHQTRWPYTVIGIGFALVGMVTVAYGFRRQQEVRHAVMQGKFTHPREDVLVGLTIVGLVLGVLLVVVIAINP